MTSLTMSLTLNLLGTFVFARSGAMLAVRRSLDVFGILVLALAAGLAGGLLRDVALGAVPPAAFDGMRYLVAALAAGVTVFFCHSAIECLNRPVMLLDALGLGLFAVTGCRKALAYGLDPLPAVILGVLTAVGGGVVRDLLVTEVPRVLREEVYALAAPDRCWHRRTRQNVRASRAACGGDGDRAHIRRPRRQRMVRLAGTACAPILMLS